MMTGRHPGLLRPSVNPDVVMMVCTAGHVDHGKTRLVKLLTGCETDRLKIEQERGMTIELGFAPCFLGGNLCVGIVDVPGHEKFVKNMVAGVSGIGMTILVIAADDGIMPQTIEHFQIMDLLGVRHGVIALTKIDLVDECRREQVAGEIRAFFRGTFLDGAPVCPVSSETGAGFFEFYDMLVARIREIVTRQGRGVFRMPIERVFIQKGFGAVVTGIPVDGTVRVGDLVELAPGGQTGKVRSIQRFLREAEEGGAGQCLALNIPDFNKQPPERGQVLCLPGYLKAAPCFHVRLRAVPGLDLPIRNGEPVKLHAGTSEQLGKVHLLDQAELNGGETGPATVVVSHPVAAAAHDRFIIRRLSPAVTIGGGDIVEITCSANRPRKKDSLELITGRVRFFEDADLTSPEGEDRKITYWLRTARRSGATVRDISRGTLLQVDAVRERLARLAEAGEVLPLTEEYHIHGEGYRACLGEIEARIREASSDQKALSLTLNDLRKGLDWVPPVWNRIFEDLEGRGMISVRGDKLLLHAAADALDAADRDLMDRILTLYEDTAFQSPRPEEVSELLHAEPAAVNRLLEYLCNQGRLVRLSKTVVLSRGAFKKAQDLVVRTIEEQGKLDSADFKYTIGSTRKYALAILDHLDARHVTVRIGNDRKLSPDYQRRLLE